jgi:HEAT repeat protein
MVWVTEFTTADTDLRIQALGSLIQTDAPRVIPILRDIALESRNPGEASRAVFVLAQSGRPDAHSTVLEVAKLAVEPVSVAAVRELGRFGGPRTSEALLEVYESGKERVKYQVVSSLGERAATSALFRIVQSESDARLRDVAIITLGRAGGRDQLQRLYQRARPDAKPPIISGLFNARAEDELISIAKSERDGAIRRLVLERLRLLGTPKARAYLEKEQTSR